MFSSGGRPQVQQFSKSRYTLIEAGQNLESQKTDICSLGNPGVRRNRRWITEHTRKHHGRQTGEGASPVVLLLLQSLHGLKPWARPTHNHTSTTPGSVVVGFVIVLMYLIILSPTPLPKSAKCNFPTELSALLRTGYKKILLEIGRKLWSRDFKSVP